MNGLRALSGMADGDMALLLGYNSVDDRGGGWFVYQGSSTATDDHGRYITPNGNPPSGRWVRLLKGESANVKMWGAVGDDSTDDTLAIMNAMAACSPTNWTRELVFPPGTYAITNTLVFGCWLHIRGESAEKSILHMKGSTNVLQSLNASYVLAGQTFDFDHWLLVEDLQIDCGINSTSNAGLVVALPGEVSIIRNLYVHNGGYGIRCLGGGAPGLRVENTSIFDVTVANVSVEGYSPTTGIALGGGDAVWLVGLSGDHRVPASDATACFVRIYKAAPGLHIENFKAEGSYGGGLIQYTWDAGSDGWFDISGSINIVGGSYDCGGTNCDFIVLHSQGQRTASVKIDNVSLAQVRYLIRDDLTGRAVLPETQVNGSALAACRLPVQYEAFVDGATNVPANRSRLIVGDTALYQFIPPVTNAWYRVMDNMYEGRLGGRLSISSINESSELSVDAATPSANPAITVIRASEDIPSWGLRPMVTMARAVTYWDPTLGGARAYLDVFVARNLSSDPYYGRLTLAHPIEGRVHPGLGAIQLLAPTNALSSLVPPGCTLFSCITNVLTR